MSKDFISISIIVPVYNVREYLPRCLESIVNQTFKDFELILVDDGSTDDSGKICDDFKMNYTDSCVVLHKSNGGLSSARLEGFKVSKGKYVCFIDSDDYLNPNYLQELFNAAENQNAEISICAYEYERAESKHAVVLPNNTGSVTDICKDYILPMLKTSNNMFPNFIWLRLMRRTLIENSFFISERAVYQEDLVFNLLFGVNLKSIAIVNKPLYVYCHNTDSLTERYRDNAWKMQINLCKFVNEYCIKHNYDVDSILKPRLLNALCFAVRNAAKLNNYKLFKNELSIIRDTREYRNTINLFSFSSATKQQRIIIPLLRIHLDRLIYNHYHK